MPFAISTDGARIHYEITGLTKRAPVLLVQGLGAEKNSWNLQRAALALRHRTIAFDNRGAGRSDKPDGVYNLEQMADDAIAVLDAAGIESAHVVGLSMGGAISQIITLKYPQRVRSLTLVATACRNHAWREELLSSWATLAQTDGMGAVAREAARWMIGPRSFRRLLPALGWMGAQQLFNPAGAFVSQINAILSTEGEELTADLSNITCPAMVVVGNQDVLTPRGDAEEIASRIATAELVIISGGAHGLHLEHAPTFNRVLLEFLHRAEKAFVPHGQAVAVAI
jgi:3-oxoadipate enol-lactonase